MTLFLAEDDALRRACCDTVIGKGHRACPIFGVDPFGVVLCACGQGASHAWMNFAGCPAVRVIPPILGVDQ